MSTEYRQQGNHYDGRRNLRDTAKLVRKDLKRVFGPNWKFGVRISRYSMGQSLSVTVKGAPVVLAGRDERYSEAGKLAVSTVQGILNSYNRQRIDSMTDYCAVHFFSHVTIDCSLLERQKAAMGVMEAA